MFKNITIHLSNDHKITEGFPWLEWDDEFSFLDGGLAWDEETGVAKLHYGWGQCMADTRSFGTKRDLDAHLVESYNAFQKRHAGIRIASVSPLDPEEFYEEERLFDEWAKTED